MTDNEFVKAFEECTLAEFHHRDHIRMAWLYLRQNGFEHGTNKVVDGIKRFAIAKGQTRLYHETITQFWIRLVAHVIDAAPQIVEFDQVMDAFPFLADAKSIDKHYSRDFLMADLARGSWREPDLLAMPRQFARIVCNAHRFVVIK